MTLPPGHAAGLQQGMTLIEIMISLAILGILVMIGMPSFQSWIGNTQVRTGAEGMLNGIQLARGEAVRRNANVSFTVGTGTGWTVTELKTNTVVQTRDAADGSQNTAVTITPAGATTLTLNGYGRVTTNADASGVITQIDITSTTLQAADARNLRIVVGSGGNVRMCDPALSSTNPQAC